MEINSHPQALPPNIAPPSAAAGRWYLAIIGLAIALLGSLFVWLMARSFLRAWEMRSWPEVACVILSSEVEQRRNDENSAPEFRQDLTYGYEWKGTARTGDHLTLRGSPWSSNRQIVEARVAEYPVGSQAVCHVNPLDPEVTVLKNDTLAPGYSIWFPALFVIGGLGITLRAATRSASPTGRKNERV